MSVEQTPFQKGKTHENKIPHPHGTELQAQH